MGFDAVSVRSRYCLERQSLFRLWWYVRGSAVRAREGGGTKTNTVAKTFIYKCDLENQVRRNPLGMVSVTWNAWGMWTGWSRLSPVERSWCRGLYLLVLGEPASLLTVPERENGRERVSELRTDWSRVGERGGRPGLFAGCKRPRCGERRAGCWFGFRIEKRVQDRSWCRKRKRQVLKICTRFQRKIVLNWV
jgi:hypothetical protein